MNVGMGRTKLGNVVVMVAEWDEKNDERSVVDGEVEVVVVGLDCGGANDCVCGVGGEYRPIIGGSL